VPVDLELGGKEQNKETSCQVAVRFY